MLVMYSNCQVRRQEAEAIAGRVLMAETTGKQSPKTGNDQNIQQADMINIQGIPRT